MQKRDSIQVSTACSLNLKSNTRILRGVSKFRECYSMGNKSSFAVVPINRLWPGECVRNLVQGGRNNDKKLFEISRLSRVLFETQGLGIFKC